MLAERSEESVEMQQLQSEFTLKKNMMSVMQMTVASYIEEMEKKSFYFRNLALQFKNPAA